MTRINVGIKLNTLTDEHLLAEHREIKRLCSHFNKRLMMNKFDDIPTTFTLGTGHVLFFMNKGKYTLKRYLMIYKECLKRNLSVECYVSNWDIYKHNRMFANDYNEHIHDTNILVERISDRLINGKKKIYHFYGNKISVEDSIKLIQTNNESIK